MDLILDNRENLGTAETKGEQETEASNYEYVESDPDITEAVQQKLAEVNPGEGLTILNGIFGYVEDVSGEKVYLSLTPYEISPQLTDTKIVRPSVKDTAAYLSETGKTFGAKSNTVYSLRRGMTVGNRLNAAKIVTNYMQEVLNPKEDSRFGPKDNRIGQTSRFLDSDGNESDRAAFLHIVPDLDILNGRIPIKYNTYKEVDLKGGKEGATKKASVKNEKPALVYMPVNFNFNHSKYTMTIKDFILSNVNEQNREIFSLDKTFDGNVLRFFGSHPKIISFGGILSNFDDDVIGFEKLVKDITGQEDDYADLQWSGDNGNSQGVKVSKRGSQRDVFLNYYQNFLKGTKAKDYGLKIYLYYNWRIIEGFITELSINTNAENDNFVSFSANMIVRSESSVYEQGAGLGRSVNFNYYSRQYGGVAKAGKSFFEMKNLFNEERSAFRKEFRNFALEEQVNSLAIRKVTSSTAADIMQQFLLKNVDTATELDLAKIAKSDFSQVNNSIPKSNKLFDAFCLQWESDQGINKLTNYYLYDLISIMYRYNRTGFVRTSDAFPVINMVNNSIASDLRAGQYEAMRNYHTGFYVGLTLGSKWDISIEASTLRDYLKYTYPPAMRSHYEIDYDSFMGNQIWMKLVGPFVDNKVQQTFSPTFFENFVAQTIKDTWFDSDSTFINASTEDILNTMIPILLSNNKEIAKLLKKYYVN